MTLASQSEKRGGVSSMAEALKQFLRASRLQRGMAEQEVLAAWGQALGPELGERARAVRFRDGELLVEVASATLLQELSNFTGESHRRAVNRRLGAERIQRVTFQPRR